MPLGVGVKQRNSTVLVPTPTRVTVGAGGGTKPRTERRVLDGIESSWNTLYPSQKSTSPYTIPNHTWLKYSV